jgi:hypothetical protein
MSKSADKLQLETYLLDLGRMLKDDAREVAQNYRAASTPDQREFLAGKRLAYYEVIITLQQQAIAFALPLGALNLADIDPDK